MRTNVTSVFRGYSTSLVDLYSMIGQTGWSVKKVKFDKKDDRYVAEAKNDHGETIAKTGPDEEMAVRNLLLAVTRRNNVRSGMVRLSMWSYDWIDKLKPIAEAYAKAPIYDPKAAAAYKELADDSMRRSEVLRNQLRIEETNNPEPYPHAQAMADDIHKRRHYEVSTANSDHPLWSPEQNVAFRIVHDVMGHGVSGGDFGWEGENKACQAHFPLLSAEAQKALFTECFPGETLVRTAAGYRPISEIKEGDLVLTGNGTFKPVLQTFERNHKGDLLEITATSSLGPIRVTPQHPFRVLVGDHPRKSKKLECNRTNCHRHPDVHSFEWVAADQISVGNYVESLRICEFDDFNVVLVPEETMKNARLAARRGPNVFTVDTEFLWVLGMYLAEGSAGSGSLSFGLHQKEKDYLQRLMAWFKQRGYGTSIRIQSGNGVELSVHSTTLAEWWPQWLGKGCQNKAIPAELLRLPSERLRPLVEGVMDGDGHYARNTLAQTSPMLALQMAEISLRLGGEPSINIYPQEAKKTVYDVVEASADHLIKRRRGRRGHWDISMGHGVQVTDVRRVQFSGPVYDLEVEGDHSFVVQNLIVHNCIAQTAYGAHYRSFGPQKVALFPQFYEPAQEAEGVHPNAPGVHPSQIMAPVAMPAMKPSSPVGLPDGTVAPHQEAFGLTPLASPLSGWIADLPIQDGRHLGAVDPGLEDPNSGYQTGIIPPEPNAYMHHGDPLEAQAVRDNASKIDTEWSQLKQGDAPDYERMKQAIENAFRVVLLSPLKDLRFNTIHYQDLMANHSTDPVELWNTLETKRQEWNVKNFGEGARFAHRPYYKLLPEFENIVYQKNPKAGWKAAQKRAQRLVFEWETQAQQRVTDAQAGVPEEKQMNHYEIENAANKDLTAQLTTFIKEYQPKLDFAAAKKPTQEEELFHIEPEVAKPTLDRYGAFMGTHLKAIAQIAMHSDEILRASLEDVHEHDGSGHHFRAAVMQLGVPGVGPKTCSFAWLLLQPMTSQLGTIDTHMMDVLGHDYAKNMNNRDYFKYERELQAGRDAAGYESVPLGQFQWGMWDLKRTGEGTHQDHSGLKVLDPTPHDAIDWQSKEQGLKGGAWAAPDWWRNTEPYRKQVGEEWDQNVATGLPKNKVPYQVVSSWKIGVALRTPWLIHPQTGERLQGLPGQSLMSHATSTLHLTTPEIWAQVAEAGKA